MGKTPQYWFKRHRFGYGWVPTTREGAIVTTMYIALMGAGVLTLKDTQHNEYTAEVGFFLLFAAIATAALVRICVVKGPKPKWRWGKKEGDNPNEDW